MSVVAKPGMRQLLWCVGGMLQSVATLCGVFPRSFNRKEGAGRPRCPLASHELVVLSRALPYVIKTIPSWAIVACTLHGSLLML